MNDPTDESLMRRLADGDRLALGQLYERHAHTALSTALSVLGERCEAEECVGDTFLTLWASASRYDVQRGSVRSFVCVVARSRARDRARRRTRRWQREIAEAPAAAAVSLDLALVHEGHFDRDFALALRRGFDALPPDERELLLLCFVRGLTHREAARHVAQPLGTVKSRVRRGLLRLRAHLTERD